MQHLSNKVKREFCKAIAYYRLSKEDRNRSNFNVSDSIENQSKLVRNYLKQHPDIELVEEVYDDGYTGTNFERPGFKYLLECIEKGIVDTVIVKDLSRLGREYIETGRYIEILFPEMNIRFISINDYFDSDNPTAADDLMIPVRNLMNENYCRELSNKLRRQFKVQRDNGEFISNFAPYGYKRDPENKHKMIIDEYPAEVVKGIFELSLKGMVPRRIADYLNEKDIVAPYEYKRSYSNYHSGFKGPGESKWNHVTVRRILMNSVYIGELCQGKTTTVSYKVKKVRLLDRKEWSTVEDAHEPIISKCIFDVIQKQLTRDIRVTAKNNEIYPLSGYVFCGDCGRGMSSRTVKRGAKTFQYYCCGRYKRNEGCTIHNISQALVEEIVLNAIKKQMKVLIDLNRLTQEIDESSALIIQKRKIDLEISQHELEIERCQTSMMRLYDSLQEELISREEFALMKEKYMKSIKEYESCICKLNKSIADIEEHKGTTKTWIQEYMKYQDIDELKHEMVVLLIDRINIYENKKIEIIFNYKDEITEIQKMYLSLKKEAI